MSDDSRLATLLIFDLLRVVKAADEQLRGDHRNLFGTIAAPALADFEFADWDASWQEREDG